MTLFTLVTRFAFRTPKLLVFALPWSPTAPGTKHDTELADRWPDPAGRGSKAAGRRLRAMQSQRGIRTATQDCNGPWLRQRRAGACLPTCRREWRPRRACSGDMAMKPGERRGSEGTKPHLGLAAMVGWYSEATKGVGHVWGEGAAAHRTGTCTPLHLW